MSKTEEEKGEGEWDQKGPGHQAEAEKWVWQDVGCAQSHSPGNSPNCMGVKLVFNSKDPFHTFLRFEVLTKSQKPTLSKDSQIPTLWERR